MRAAFQAPNRLDQSLHQSTWISALRAALPYERKGPHRSAAKRPQRSALACSVFAALTQKEVVLLVQQYHNWARQWLQEPHQRL